MRLGIATYAFITDGCCLGSSDFCSLSQVGEKLGAGDSAIFMLDYENRGSVPGPRSRGLGQSDKGDVSQRSGDVSRRSCSVTI